MFPIERTWLPFRQIAFRSMAVGLLAVALTGCGDGGGSGGDTKEAAGNPQLLAIASADTQAIYKKRCMSCHGDGLQGRIGPTTNLTQVGGRLSAEQIETQIRKGGNGMPGFQDDLMPEQIDALKLWLAGLK